MTLFAGDMPPPTPTPLDASVLAEVFMETQPGAVDASRGGIVAVRAFAFDGNNQPVNNVEFVFERSPEVGTVLPPAIRTGAFVANDGRVIQGVAETAIDIPPGPGQGHLGPVAVRARSGAAEGATVFSIVSDGEGRVVDRVELEIEESTCSVLH